MPKQINQLYEFNEFRINVAERLLQRRGQEVPLPPKVFDLLLAVVERHGQVVTKDQLMTEIRPDTFVEEANLKVYFSTLRKAFGDGCEFIETLPKRGYRFVAEVRDIQPSEAELVTEMVIEKQSVSRVAIEEEVSALMPQ